MLTLAFALLAAHHVAALIAAAISLAVIGMATSPVGPGNLIVTPLGTFTAQAAASLGAGPFVPIAASGAINPHLPGRYVITKAGVAALTLAAPTPGTDDGVMIEVISSTANAHTLTATGLLKTGSASVNEATYAAFAGANLILQAYQGAWYVSSMIAITFS